MWVFTHSSKKKSRTCRDFFLKFFDIYLIINEVLNSLPSDLILTK